MFYQANNGFFYIDGLDVVWRCWNNGTFVKVRKSAQTVRLTCDKINPEKGLDLVERIDMFRRSQNDIGGSG